MNNSKDNHALNDAEFLHMMYRTALGREPEEGIIDFFQQQIRSGALTRKGLIEGMVGVPEFQARRDAQIKTALESPQIRPEWWRLFSDK